MEITQEAEKRKRIKKIEDKRTSWTTSSIITFTLYESKKEKRERKGQRTYLKK